MSEVMSIDNTGLKKDIHNMVTAFIESIEPLAKIAKVLKNASTSNEVEKQEKVLQDTKEIIENSSLKQSLESFKNLNANDIAQLTKEVVSEIGANEGETNIQSTILEIKEYLDSIKNHEYLLGNIQESDVGISELKDFLNFTNTMEKFVDEIQISVGNEDDLAQKTLEEMSYWIMTILLELNITIIYYLIMC